MHFDVTFPKSEWRAECENWKPTTAAGADLLLSVTNTAWVAVTSVLLAPPEI